MFIGHFALGFAGKKADRRISLGTLFLAAQWLDLIWPVLILTGLEKVEIDPGNTALTPLHFTSYPYSHSLLMALVWGLLFALLYAWRTGHRKGAVLLGLLVLSHWVLDWFTHAPDLPLAFGNSSRLGLGLWNYPSLSIFVETTLFLLGVWWYLSVTRERNKTGTWAFWALVLFLLLIHFANAFGEPPPSATAVGWVGLSQWLIILWAYWIDRNREARPRTGIAGQNSTKPV